MSSKAVPLFDLSGPVRDFNAATKNGFLVLTRRGKPIAYILPTRFYDEEDIGYMTDPEFWKMIRQRRMEPTIPFEEVKRSLELRERKSNLKSKRAKKGKQ